MSQPNIDPERYKSRGRKERTPAQLAVLAQAREKAKIVIAERAKISAFQKTVSPEPEPVAVSDLGFRCLGVWVYGFTWVYGFRRFTGL